MSNRAYTPVQQRVKQCEKRASKDSAPRTPATKATPNTNGLRRNVIANAAKLSTEQLPKSDDTTPSILNTAFNIGSQTPRSVPKGSAPHASHTPSSLYRNTKNTPITVTNTKTISKTPISNATAANKDKNNWSNSEEISNMTVAVRVRPLNAAECTRPCVTNVVKVHGESNELTVIAGTSADGVAGVTHFFSYDHVFYSCDPESKMYANQSKVFENTAQPLIDTAFEGYNACLFAYGQTGSGKSYSMMGIEALDDAALDGSAPHPEAGIIPRFCHELFERIHAVKSQIQVEIEVSYFEIYNEKIHDLLCVQQAAAATQHSQQAEVTSSLIQRQALKVREHPIWGPYVVDLSVHSVDSYAALRNWLAVGNSQRATAATAMNDKSSRSHSIFNIDLQLTDLNSDDSLNTDTGDMTTTSIASMHKQMRRSKISLVDLAGSERISVSGSNGERIREGVSINKSLLTLGKVIAALADTKKQGTQTTFVPYRESVLTWLLRENLGGNSKTVMLATISPASIHVDETLATLRYACKARSIVNRIKVNESPHDKIIRDLRAEVERLKSLRNEYERQRRLSGNSNPAPRKIIIETSVDESEVEALRQQLAERERELMRAQKSWMERLKEAEDQRKCELRMLKRKGLALELTTEEKQACLVNLTADPMLSGTLFYILPPGKVKIGRTKMPSYGTEPDIVLEGPLVAQQHCTIENELTKLYVTPESEDFETYLNGELVYCRKQMFHGDRLVIGGSHYFRISNPFCTRKDKNMLVDFQLAHQEILQKQEQQLRRELEAEKRAALIKIEQERAAHERDFNERLQYLELEQLKQECNRELLETERQAFEAENTVPVEEIQFVSNTPASKSTILEDIQRIMLNPSEESLHKTQLMVKEATQRCRSLGLHFEFKQAQSLDEFGMLHTTILILDKTFKLKAEWPIARLGVWLDILRDNGDERTLNGQTIFQNMEIDWQPLDIDLNETLNDTQNTSRISLNLSAVKDKLFKQPLKQLLNNIQNTPTKTSTPVYMKSPVLQHVKKMLTYDMETELTTCELQTEEQSFPMLAAKEVRNMYRAAVRLKQICGHVLKETENVQPADVALASILCQNVCSLENIILNMNQGIERAVTQTNEVNSPTKVPKAVRFLVD